MMITDTEFGLLAGFSRGMNDLETTARALIAREQSISRRLRGQLRLVNDENARLRAALAAERGHRLHAEYRRRQLSS